MVEENFERVSTRFADMCQAQFKVELLLNPNETDHGEIVDKMREIRMLVFLKEDHSEQIDILIDELLSVSKKVLKREWNVVKKGK